ncbi:MAG TPA: PLDc N-terminal domain-containing protein [Actinomycetota bacterium]|nr:PLDc N-terminal domain-containing protein [Actinomycetota bacterium]
MVGRRSIALVFAGALATLAVATPAVGTEGYGATVSAIDNLFSPPVVRVEPGDTVEWTMGGQTAHTVRADDGSWDSGALEPGDEYDMTFEEPGVFSYFCEYHGAPGSGMAGVVLVGDVPLPGSNGDVGPGREAVPGGFAETVLVPNDAATIQEAVDAARPGGMVLIDAGVYRESVTVRTPFLTIRGMDRNRVVIDGGFERAIGIHVIEADGVTIENLTVRNHLLNGVQWTNVHGYWGSFLTAYNNGDYGVFAYDSDWGQFDRSYAGGSPDSGFYIGQCFPCHAVVRDVLAEHNALGYSGTNAGGDLAIVNSEWRHNLAGIVPNTLDSEADPPQREMVIAGNFVHDNNSTTADTKALTYPTFGSGILVTGGIGNLIAWNLVQNHESYGIAVLPNIDRNVWVTSGNEVRENVVRASGLADLALGAPAAGTDCFEGNDAGRTAPPAIELLRGCDSWLADIGGGSIAPTLNAAVRFLDALDGSFPHGDWRTQPAPPDQPTMPDPENAPPRPAIPEQSVPQPYRIRAVGSMDPAPPTVDKELSVFGTPLATSWWSLLIGLYGYVLPGILYAAWVTIALWDLIRQESQSISFRARWMAAVLLVPFAGPLLYFAFGRSPIPSQLRLMLTVGGLVATLSISALAALLGG